MEIGIIASVLELLFNYQNYSQDMRYIFLGVAVSFAAIYAFRHDTLVRAMKESRDENQQWINDDHVARLETSTIPKVETTEEEMPVIKKTVRKTTRKRVTRKRVATK